MAHAFIDGNKRTGALAAITFMNQHGMDLMYPLGPANSINGLSAIIEKCADSQLTRDELMVWFDSHKTWLEE